MSGEAYQRAWTEDEDALAPSPELARYVKALDDRVVNYRRFFHALLVKTPDHEIFFQDLRAFREQDHVTVLLTTPEDDPCRLKAIYQECTRHFLASRFAHPWCRNEYGKHKYGFLHTTKSRQRKAEVKVKEEERLHKLLVPLWIPFRRRMMPSSEEMADFLEQERLLEARRLELKEHEEKRQRRQRQDEALAKLASEVDDENKDLGEHEDVSGLEFRPTSQATPSSGPTYFNAEAFVAEEDDVAHVQQRSDGTHQAASLFVGLAATSFLSKNKRASKYLLKKLNQR